MPKVGNEQIRNILEKLKEHSNTVLEDVMARNVSSGEETDHVLWRRRGISYFINPMLEDLYAPGERPDETQPVYFDSELKRDTAFLLLQSSLFYLYWMAYGDERHLNWTEVEAFPFPDEGDLEEYENEITELADELWEDMEGRFIGGSREVFRRAAELKPHTDRADDIFAPMYGLDEEEVEFVKKYQETYRLSSIDGGEEAQTQLPDAETE